MDRTVSFLASLPDKSGISRHSDGATVRLDVPETEIAAMAPLLALTRVVLRITVTVEAQAESPHGQQSTKLHI